MKTGTGRTAAMLAIIGLQASPAPVFTAAMSAKLLAPAAWGMRTCRKVQSQLLGNLSHIVEL